VRRFRLFASEAYGDTSVYVHPAVSYGHPDAGAHGCAHSRPDRGKSGAQPVMSVGELIALSLLVLQYPTATPTEEPTAAPTAAPTQEPTAVSVGEMLPLQRRW
jgi:hypothetical protein